MEGEITLIPDDQDETPEYPKAHHQPKNRTAEHLKPYRFKKGQSGNPGGRPVGSVSPMTAIKNYFAGNPEDFEMFIMDYMQNPYNAKHIIEMWEGRPAQRVNLEGEITKKLIRLD